MTTLKLSRVKSPAMLQLASAGQGEDFYIESWAEIMSSRKKEGLMRTYLRDFVRWRNKSPPPFAGCMFGECMARLRYGGWQGWELKVRTLAQPKLY